MKIDPPKLIGSVSAAAVILLLLIILRQGFTPFEYCHFQIEDASVPIGADTGREVSRIIWGARQLDMIALAFLLFVAAAGCASILRSEREETK